MLTPTFNTHTVEGKNTKLFADGCKFVSLVCVHCRTCLYVFMRLLVFSVGVKKKCMYCMLIPPVLRNLICVKVSSRLRSLDVLLIMQDAKCDQM